MNKLGKRILYTVLTAVTLISFSSCSHEEDWMSLPNGKLQFSIGQISTETGTRATPSELGKPLADKFNLKVQRVNSDYIAYEGSFVESLEIKVGNYDITASCGDDVLIGRDAPYYIGTTQTTIRENQPTSAIIPCRVGNALVSVRFGRNQTEQQRFAKFYEEYGLLVKNGDNSMAIGKDETASSIYFPAGTSPELIFYGTLKLDGGRTVSTILTHKSLPTVFDAADHAIITISLPDPESAIAVNISKVELVEAKLDETIPLSWLPVPSATASHNYNNQGILMGTDLTFSNTYPEMTWEARVSNAQGDTVRRITGMGELISEYTTSTEWPYLQAGRYKATYFLHTVDGISKVSSREFNIGSPQININISGYTSYDKYLAGDIDAANGLDGHTVYEPRINVGISPALTSDPKYSYKMTYTFNGQTHTTENNTQTLSQQELQASSIPHVLYATVEFAGEEARANRGFQITGIPLVAAPPTTTDGWAATTGGVEFTDSYVRLGKSNWMWGEGDDGNFMQYTNIAIPSGTTIASDYHIVIHPATIGTRFTCKLGNTEIINHNHDGGAFNKSDYPFSGTQSHTLTESISQIVCRNSYGAGQTRTDVYKINLSYGK